MTSRFGTLRALALASCMFGGVAHAQDTGGAAGGGGSGGGDPMMGDTQATQSAAAGTNENFDIDDAPPGAETSVAEQLNTPPPPTGKPAKQYGRRDPFLPLRLDAHASLTWDGNFGFGVRADFPLISGTFRYSNRDELSISAGADLTFISFSGSHQINVYPTAVLQWSLGLSERTFLYPEFGLVGIIEGSDWQGLRPNIGFGTRYYVHRSLSLQARLGWPVAFSGGVTF